MPVILATQEAEIRRIEVQSQPEANRSETVVQKPYLEKTHHKKGLVEWLKQWNTCLASMKP
jgi:hypothetical protein